MFCSTESIEEVSKMIETVLTALEKSTPTLRQRYLDRIRTVSGAEARAIEEKLVDFIERDKALAGA
jgi:hypothetical protein